MTIETHAPAFCPRSCWMPLKQLNKIWIALLTKLETMRIQQKCFWAPHLCVKMLRVGMIVHCTEVQYCTTDSVALPSNFSNLFWRSRWCVYELWSEGLLLFWRHINNFSILYKKMIIAKVCWRNWYSAKFLEEQCLIKIFLFSILWLYLFYSDM